MLTDEPLISLTRAAARFPGTRGADRTHPATLTRWIRKGVRALDGRRVKLEAVRIGSRWLTSEPALARFAQARGRPPVLMPRAPRMAQELVTVVVIGCGAGLTADRSAAAAPVRSDRPERRDTGVRWGRLAAVIWSLLRLLW